MWAPDADKKWYLITSIDDHSRDMLYADLWEQETTWAHIQALKSVITSYGRPLRYYVDQHSIFRFIANRDSLWQKQTEKEEGEAFVQWKEVLSDLDIKVTYALSPAAKGKVERPYRWLQDHLVRSCVRNKVKTIQDARQLLYTEIHQYRHKRIHSTTQNIPSRLFTQSQKMQSSLFRPFNLKSISNNPKVTLDDIFALRFQRTLNRYRQINFHNLTFTLKKATIGKKVHLRLSFDRKNNLIKIRFWFNKQLLDQKLIKKSDLPKLQF